MNLFELVAEDFTFTLKLLTSPMVSNQQIGINHLVKALNRRGQKHFQKHHSQHNVQGRQHVSQKFQKFQG